MTDSRKIQYALELLSEAQNIIESVNGKGNNLEKYFGEALGATSKKIGEAFNELDDVATAEGLKWWNDEETVLRISEVRLEAEIIKGIEISKDRSNATVGINFYEQTGHVGLGYSGVDTLVNIYHDSDVYEVFEKTQNQLSLKGRDYIIE